MSTCCANKGCPLTSKPLYYKKEKGKRIQVKMQNTPSYHYHVSAMLSLMTALITIKFRGIG